MKKLQNLQALRGIAVLSVVVYHLINIEKKFGGETRILSDYLEIGMFGVDLFFVLSGFVMVIVSRGIFKNKKLAFQFLYNRVTRIYPTYWVYSLVVLMVFIVFPKMVNSSQGNQIDIISSFLLWPTETLPLVMVGWTLIHELYFYLIFFLILLFSSEKKLAKILMAWAGGILFFNLFINDGMSWVKIIIHPLTFEFIFGCLLGILHFRFKNSFLKIAETIVLLSVSFMSMLWILEIYQSTTGEIEPQNWWRPILLGIPASIIVYGFINLEKLGVYLNSNLVKVGDASYSIYLSHLLTLSLTGRIWSRFSNDGIYDNLIMIPLQFVIVIFVGLISYYFLEKPLLNFTRKISRKSSFFQ